LTVGEACTQDARLHQVLLFNPLFEKTLALCQGIRAAGICRAHSGTLFGLLVNENALDEADVSNFCKTRLPANIQVRWTSLVDGGPRTSPGIQNTDKGREV
jgi:uncharacterized protein involved in propanediol utilization